MKKFLAAALLAVALSAASQQSADAWCNFKFGIGMNFAFSSGNNCWPCGIFHNGQAPAGFCMPGGDCGDGGFAMGGYGMGAPYAYGMTMPGFGYGYAGTMQQPGYNYAGTPAPSPYQLMSYPGAGYYAPNYYSTGYYGY